MYSEEERQLLHQIARDSISYGLKHGKPMSVQLDDYPASFSELKASFVTLHIAGNLRGCIGALSPVRPLAEDIAHNAWAAAFTDPRFPPLSEAEYPRLHYHLSILGETSPITFSSEADLLEQIEAGIDGLILEDNYHRGTFLPSVWEQIANKSEFLQHLKLKAGLPSNYWSDTLKVSRYHVESF